MPINPYALRAIRERSGLSVSALAELAGASQPHLSNIERGRRQASPDLICRLAKALKVPTVALLADVEAAPRGV
ncbi:MAG TPA: helix-turn-helix transcriptional regulator [Acidimicrobiales bacterium]